MGLFKKLGESADLVTDMADRLDVDLEHIDGLDTEGSIRRYRSAVMACSTCGKHGECRHLLDDNVKLADAPDYCRNRSIMHR